MGEKPRAVSRLEELTVSRGAYSRPRRPPEKQATVTLSSLCCSVASPVTLGPQRLPVTRINYDLSWFLVSDCVGPMSPRIALESPQ